jgi:two-component system chemotaxis response regulator CheV
MPIMDGRQLISVLKSDSTFRSIPIVVFSSIVENDNLYNESLIKADRIEGKPNIEGLINRVNELLNND